MRSLALLASILMALAGCNGSTGHGTATLASTTTSPSPPPSSTPTAQVYTITPVGSTTVTGPLGTYDPVTMHWSGVLALAVTVTLNGQPVDGVTVDFSPVLKNFGPWGCGTDTSGAGSWTFSGPGTGIAVVGAIPAVLGAVEVEAQVIPTQGSVPGSNRTSNIVSFSVEGR